MSEPKEVRIYPYIVEGTDELKLAKQAIEKAFSCSRFNAKAGNRVMLAGQSLLVLVDPLLRGGQMMLRVESKGKTIEVPRFQFR